MKYRCYVDEVGNPDLDSSDNPNHRFLSLTGVIARLDHIQELVHPQMEQLKQSFFQSHPDEPVILHRKEMVNCKGCFRALKEPEVKSRFDSQLLQLLNSWEFHVITVCIDKMKHRETYQVWRYDPYHYCLEVLLERYCFFLEGVKAVGDVMAESRSGKEDMRLKKAFHRIWETGTDYVTPDRFQAALASRQLKVKSKLNNVSGLQLADLLAHPSRNELLHERKLLDRELPPFGQAIIQILQGKYYQKAGRMYGKKFI